MKQALFEEIEFIAPQMLFQLFADEPGCVFLESSGTSAIFDRYCFLGFDPFLQLQAKDNQVTYQDQTSQQNPFIVLRKLLAEYTLELVPNLPPFQGGVMGFFSYDLVQHLEKITLPIDQLYFPDLQLGFYDIVIVCDFLLQKTWLMASGLPERTPHLRTLRAKQRLAQAREKLQKSPRRIPIVDLEALSFQANFTRDNYLTAVNIIKGYILAGDIFQANLSQAFQSTLPINRTARDLYWTLRSLNHAPFSAFLQFGETSLVSLSPERFIQLVDRQIETRPIKGTAPRGATKQEDDQLKRQLLNSEKNRAENIMIVDLLRNDLSRVAKPNSVQVTQLCECETYETVHHLVSAINATLRPECGAIDLLQASFPGGSITGAPKVRAMEIISELEPTRRGPYCGCVGYIGFDGNMDTSIAIRTLAMQQQKMSFNVGGAIVVDSDAAAEYEETLIKARFTGIDFLKRSS
jgi:para-aminobenzoate synthetase component 1